MIIKFLLKYSIGIVLVLSTILVACNGSVPPRMTECYGDGLGGADCTEVDGKTRKRESYELLNWWITDSSGKKEMVDWCYRKDQTAPPIILICFGDGTGGADCIERDDTESHKSPSDLLNYFMTKPEEWTAFVWWCYS